MSTILDETFCMYCQVEFETPRRLCDHVLTKHPGTYAEHAVKEAETREGEDPAMTTPTFTHHARLRMEQTGLCDEDIAETLAWPEVRTLAVRTRDRYGNRVQASSVEDVFQFRRDGHAVIADCTDPECPKVITVLVRTSEQYERPDKQH